MKNTKTILLLITTFFFSSLFCPELSLAKGSDSFESHEAGQNGQLPNSPANLNLLLKFTTALGGLVGLKTRDQVEMEKKSNLEKLESQIEPIIETNNELENEISIELAQETEKLEQITSDKKSPIRASKRSPASKVK